MFPRRGVIPGGETFSAQMFARQGGNAPFTDYPDGETFGPYVSPPGLCFPVESIRAAPTGKHLRMFARRGDMNVSTAPTGKHFFAPTSPTGKHPVQMFPRRGCQRCFPVGMAV